MMVPPHTTFSKVKRVNASKQPRKKNHVALLGVGHQGINQAIRSLQLKKETGEEAGIIILIHADSNYLSEAEKRASEFISKDRIFSIHSNMLDGNGNGKNFERCIRNYPNWHGLVDDIIPKVVGKINNRGSWVLECHSSSGGSAPVLVYFIEKARNYFHFTFVVIGEPCDSASRRNLSELFSKLASFDSTCKILYTGNSEIGNKREEVDFAIICIVNAMTSGCGSDGWDVVDFVEQMPKCVEVRSDFGIIPHFSFMLFWEVQNHERTLQVVKTLLEGLKIRKNDMGFLIGKVSPDLAKLGVENAYPIATPLLHCKIIKVGIGNWNVVGGKVTGFTPEKIATPNFDRLKKMMEK